jgi:hypothetical protein
MKVTPERISRDKVATVYSGKINTCCCGCSGTHSDKPAQITRVLNIMLANIADASDLDNCVAVEVGSRQYVAYFPEAETAASVA